MLLTLFAWLCTTAHGHRDLLQPLIADYKDRGLISTHTVNLAGLAAPVQYLQAGSGPRLVVLLHGMAFTAETWKWTGTLDALSDEGFTVVALELTQYAGQYASDAVRQRLLRDFLKAAGLEKRRLVVVAASMGGLVGSPYVRDAKSAARAEFWEM